REDDVCLVWEHLSAVPMPVAPVTSIAPVTSVAPVAPVASVTSVTSVASVAPTAGIVVPVEEGSRPRISQPPPNPARASVLVLVDDDLGLPRGFLDGLIGWQRALGWALAQPARTARSFVDHRIVQQQPGVAARRTRFVEIGPVVSIHRSAFELLLPFDLASPM